MAPSLATLYVAFEGIDGAGKSTQVRRIATRFEADYGSGSVAVLQFNDQENVIGRFMHNVFESPNHPMQWFIRRRWVREFGYALSARLALRRAVNANVKVVVSDRSVITPCALHLGKLPLWYIRLVEPWHIPDIVVFLVIKPEIALERITARGPSQRGEAIEALRRKARDYMLLFDNLPPALADMGVLRIDASHSPEIVTTEVYAQIQRVMREPGKS